MEKAAHAQTARELNESHHRMPSSWSRFLAEALQDVVAQNRKRVRRVFAGDALIDFGSNDYLGLRSHPAVLTSLQARGARGGWGAGASPLLSGYSQEHLELEKSLADFSNTESALVFTSGYACNLGTIACLADEEDLIISDRFNHASLIDGCRLSRATKLILPHADIDFLRARLRAERHRFVKVLLLSESIFSMDGDAAPLAELADVAESYDCGLLVDEAHAVGVYGENGGGLLEELGLHSRALAKLGTLSKALGGTGGYVAADDDLIEYLVNRCRSYMFSTASPPLNLSAANTALRLLRSMTAERRQLRQHARRLRARLGAMGLKVMGDDSPIIPIVFGRDDHVLQISQRLRDEKIYVPAIRPPTVPAGTSRLRISLSALHTAEHTERLVAALQAAV